MESKMSTANSRIFSTILELYPELEFMVKFPKLSKEIRQSLLPLKPTALWHTDHHNIKKEFLVDLFANLGLEDLNEINLEFSAVTDDHFILANQQSSKFQQFLSNHLSNLNLNGCREISDKTIMILATRCKNLDRIELYWNCRVNDFCIKKLARSNTELTYVNLSGCKYLSDSSVVELASQCPKISHLNITRIPKLTDKSLSALQGNSGSLVYLNLYANSNIQNAGFMSLGEAPRFANMTFLDFCGCKFLLDDAVIAISSTCINLEYFNLTWCVSLTDRAIVEGVAKHLKVLNLLSVYGLERMTDAIMTALEGSPLQDSLETLDINGCKLISCSGDAIKTRFPNVRCTIFHS